MTGSHPVAITAALLFSVLHVDTCNASFHLFLVCGILVPCSGIEIGPPAVEAWSFNHLNCQGSLSTTLLLKEASHC